MSLNTFNSVQLERPKHNLFNLTHDHKLSCNMGELIPIMCEEFVPGDKVNIGCEAMVRFAPLVSPVMHRFDVSIHYFAVPYRLLWDGFEEWYGNTGDPLLYPYFDYGAGNYTRLMDYMGLPTPVGIGSETNLSVLPFVAYQMIYNEYYRDQNLINEVDLGIIAGNNSAETQLFQLRKRAWEKDYFTSALPWPQKGDAVGMPLGEFSDVPVYLTAPGVADSTLSATPTNIPVQAQTPDQPFVNTLFAQTSTMQYTVGTINEFRRALALQEYLERMALGGSRYTEIIKATFGVTSSDKRLQRPEYITGIREAVSISEVLNNTGTEEAPQGDMAGHGIAYMNGNRYGTYYCEEHTYIIGIMSVMPKPAYQNGIPKHFLKTSDQFQLFQPKFAHIGEQAIENRELYAFGASPQGTFGYQSRYVEYKYLPNRVSGDFRNTLSHWTAARIFASAPSLNTQFIEMNSTEVDRIFAVQEAEDQKLWCQVVNKISAARPMPVYGSPSI